MAERYYFKNKVLHIYPDLLLENIYWSFKEPVPKSSTDFITAIKRYYDQVFKQHFDENLLTDLSPFYSLDIGYSYATQKADGAWDDISMLVRIDGGKNRLSNADILWQLHKNVHTYLKDQDHCYFEGLGLCSEENELGIPYYLIWLGS